MTTSAFQPSHCLFALFILLGIGWGLLAGEPALTVYALSFWHYYLYWLAYRFRSVAPSVFRRDAITLKTIALLALASAYLSAPPDLLSILVVAAGFALNLSAARALGAERTYYGHELAGMPPLRVTAFPYSWIAHPMLAGNIIAFGGTMINPEFRREWWPLAGAHVLLNAGLLVMECVSIPHRPGGSRVRQHTEANTVLTARLPFMFCITVAGAALGGLFGLREGNALPGAAAGAIVCAHAIAIYLCYSNRKICPDQDSDTKRRTLHE